MSQQIRDERPGCNRGALCTGPLSPGDSYDGSAPHAQIGQKRFGYHGCRGGLSGQCPCCDTTIPLGFHSGALGLTNNSSRDHNVYTKEYFLERFSKDETKDLLHLYATEDLSDEAKEAILSLFKSRGIQDAQLQPLLLQAKKASYRKTKGTNECDFCDSSALFSPVIDEGQRFCSQACLGNARLLELAEDIPKEEIHGHALRIKNSPCPVCQKSGSKTEVRRFYRVWSLILLTRWTRHKRICCHSCARKTNLGSLVFCTLFGWWGLPWGLIMTPVQIVSNITEMFKTLAEPAPSEALLQAAKLDLAAMLQQKRALHGHANKADRG